MPNICLESIAAKAAAKICGQGKCLAPYPCGHPNRAGSSLPAITDGTVCPLAKYNIEPSTDTRPWYERPRSETEVGEDELFALCAMCEHGKVKNSGGQPVVERTRFVEVCLDCPVYSAGEAMNEAAAEARGS